MLRLLSRTMGNFLTYCCEYIYECYNRKSHRPQHVNKKTHTRSKRPILVLNVDNNDSVSNIVPQVEAIRGDIELHYHINSKPIGLGSSSNVYSATNKLTGSSVAIKQINFTQDQDNVLGEHQRHTICEQIEQEVVSLRSISHPHLIRLREVYQDQYSVYLVTDLYTGGELFNLVDVSGNIPEMYARKILRQILEAVQHCHENNITHRDLKLENGEPFLSNKLASQIFQHGLAPTLGDKPLRKSFAYAGNDGLSIASLAIRPKKGGDLATVSDHDFYYWSGFSGSGLWVDKSTGTAGVLLTQFYPSDRFLIPKLVAEVRATLN